MSVPIITIGSRKNPAIVQRIKEYSHGVERQTLKFLESAGWKRQTIIGVVVPFTALKWVAPDGRTRNTMEAFGEQISEDMKALDMSVSQFGGTAMGDLRARQSNPQRGAVTWG